MKRQLLADLPKKAEGGFQRIEESYMVPTYRVSDYLGEMRPAQRLQPTKADLQALIERCRANVEDCVDSSRPSVVRITDILWSVTLMESPSEEKGYKECDPAETNF